MNDDFTAIAYALPYFLEWHHLLMSGTVEFIMRIANDTPSGYAPKYLMSMVSTPIPTPNITPPRLLIGDVT